ncbi:MAG TPA: DUF882 domain-containing protein [Polyangia bacterium]|nr:DUF882 domain-containing protein [Polyangia bacterium]
MARGPTDPTLDLARILKQKDRPAKAKARWRIMVASDPSRPVRTFTLPRLLPTLLSLFTISLVAATVILAFGSWKLSGSLGALQHRVRAMVQAADSVALAPGADARAGQAGLELAAAASTRVVQTSGARFGKFVLQSVNTGEEVEISLNLDTGEVDPVGYTRLRHIMRCQRTTAETPIDPRLIDLLYRIAQRTHQKLQLVSGFRAPMFSLAALSYHTRGMAADIRIPGMTPLMARDLAESMGVHGLGYYPVSGFIHVDVRDDFTRWTDYGQNRQDGEGTEHGPSHGEEVQRGEIAAGSGPG